MKILIIDDDERKRDRIAHALASAIDPAVLQAATTYEEALQALQSRYFDLVILDLLLPGGGGEPSETFSRSIIHQILSGSGMIPPMHIIGLTAYGEIAERERPFYDEHLFALETYSETGDDWASRLCAKIEYLRRSRDAAASYKANNFDLDVFVLTARYANEYVPARKVLLPRVIADRHPLWKGEISFGMLRLRDGRELSAAVACVAEMGMAPTASVASQAISVFRPRLIGMVGMCCGFAVEDCSSPRRIMDAIVVRDVACWEEGKYVELADSTSEFRSRAKVRMVDDQIRDEVDGIVERASTTLEPTLARIAKSSAYRGIRDHFGGRVREAPEVKFSSIVSGSSVIADESVVRDIISRHPAAVGLDMEIYGLYAAAERAQGLRPSVVGVKGVADFGEVRKDDKAQRAATTVASTVFKSLVEHLSIFPN
jgi:CheY-like chemotaxis protein/nucleoside phosphorylase